MSTAVVGLMLALRNKVGIPASDRFDRCLTKIQSPIAKHFQRSIPIVKKATKKRIKQEARQPDNVSVLPDEHHENQNSLTFDLQSDVTTSQPMAVVPLKKGIFMEILRTEEHDNDKYTALRQCLLESVPRHFDNDICVCCAGSQCNYMKLHSLVGIFKSCLSFSDFKQYYSSICASTHCQGSPMTIDLLETLIGDECDYICTATCVCACHDKRSDTCFPMNPGEHQPCFGISV